ncbi:xylose isomerase-like protein [Mytilinidion resinicola]|uniref:Xylose isomerase-like protein n=1 Tax=Mytilinidion resinicola TaxID=574789 RepID=A0A6A6Y4W0_9PEZI|nr:xylose isomerase-like protein [Mytilinidion resinicola]KAF2803846.1 xylose isomerase-like protein [Mytilinidion resinicola]
MSYKPAISTMSLGRCWAGHDFTHKLDMAAKHNLTGIEIFFEDLEDVAAQLPGGATPANQIQASKNIAKLCADRGLTIIGLQPFLHYEGLYDRAEHAKRIEKLKLWLQLAKALGTDIIQIPTNFLPASECSSDIDLIVADMVEVADMGAAQDPPIKFAYESLAWATHIDTWERCCEIVAKVDRPNFGLCLDTFNIAGRVYADPAAVSGKTVNAEADMAASIARLLKTVDVKKVFYIQVVDAERLAAPLIEGHEFWAQDQVARMSWSRNCRLFYGEQELGGYLPVLEITRAFIEGLGYEGWVSMELFSRVMTYKEKEIPEQLASRAATAWSKLERDLGLNAVKGAVNGGAHLEEARL